MKWGGKKKRERKEGGRNANSSEKVGKKKRATGNQTSDNQLITSKRAGGSERRGVSDSTGRRSILTQAAHATAFRTPALGWWRREPYYTVDAVRRGSVRAAYEGTTHE